MLQVPVFRRNTRHERSKRPRRPRQRTRQQQWRRSFGLSVARVDDPGGAPQTRGKDVGRPGRGPRGDSCHLQTVGFRVVQEPVPGEPGAAEELREDETVRAQQEAADERSTVVRPDVRDEASEEQRGGQEVEGCQATKVHREPNQRHVFD